MYRSHQSQNRHCPTVDCYFPLFYLYQYLHKQWQTYLISFLISQQEVTHHVRAVFGIRHKIFCVHGYGRTSKHRLQIFIRNQLDLQFRYKAIYLESFSISLTELPSNFLDSSSTNACNANIFHLPTVKLLLYFRILRRAK